MTEAAGRSRLLGNSAWNATAFLVGAGLNLLILPFVVYRLGIAAFGLVGLVTACLAPALIFSNSLGLAVTRELAQRLTIDEQSDARRFFAAGLILALTIGSVVALFLVLAGPPIARALFNLTNETAEDLNLAFSIGAVSWLCQCFCSVLLSLLTARQDYVRISRVNMLSTSVVALAVLIVIPYRPLASTFFGCQALGPATTMVTLSVLGRWLFSDWIGVPGFHRGPIRQLTRFGTWQVMAQAGGLISGQADRYLLGALLSPQFVGFYTIAQRLEEAVYIGILKVGEILFPFFSSMQRETVDRKAELLFRSSWILNLLAASLLGGLIPVAGPLLYLWTGPEVALQAEDVLVMLSIAGIIGSSSNVFAFYLLANGLSRHTALIATVTAIATLATSALVLPLFGWQGAGWSTCVGMIAQISASALLLAQVFQQDDVWSRFLHFIVAPLLTGVVTALLLRHAVDGALSGVISHWWLVGALYCVGVAIIFAAVLLVSQVGPHRSACRRDLQAVMHRFSPTTGK